jgi:Na+-transporting NADH:ubiquinone oxidoreductase subunit NqrE
MVLAIVIVGLALVAGELFRGGVYASDQEIQQNEAGSGCGWLVALVVLGGLAMGMIGGGL